MPPPQQGAWLPPDQPLRGNAVPPGRDDTLDVETDAYIHCVSAFVKLAQSEYQLLTDVIPEHHQKKTFDSLIQVLPLPALFLGPYQMPRKSCCCGSWSSGQTCCPVAFS